MRLLGIVFVLIGVSTNIWNGIAPFDEPRDKLIVAQLTGQDPVPVQWAPAIASVLIVAGIVLTIASQKRIKF